MRLDLSSITLVSLVWDKSREHMDRTVRVLNYMNHIAEFDETVLFGACPANGFEGRFVQVPVMDEIGWQVFQMKIMPGLIHSASVMHVHDDGFIIDPAWETEFQEFDYIGAPWADGVVGNDGFCIQSQEFLWAKARLPFCEPKQGDEYLCREQRSLLESKGIRFAPTDVAARFSTETYHCDQPSFGFHGITHDRRKYDQGWKQIEQWEASK